MPPPTRTTLIRLVYGRAQPRRPQLILATACKVGVFGLRIVVVDSSACMYGMRRAGLARIKEAEKPGRFPVGSGLPSDSPIQKWEAWAERMVLELVLFLRGCRLAMLIWPRRVCWLQDVAV